MTDPYAIVGGAELDALLRNLAGTERCDDCGGEPAIVAAERDITAELLHRPDCPDVLEVHVDDALRHILGDPT
ncbi:hypothetical protein GCM10009676_31160 [Prauserella halophila]|uniref:Uncharacterized protein n=1 Tax=Prauserella halophila TaxID=185641 RepID=A0ABN1WES3_9PSEU|nr:hypothetical protein [Prauserella halophila]MCP2234742.1 hypothetical protein [Prauserella halophila]